jgi:aspartyl-tRNA(Asn)/glutamyl-tRNA(Gln) amidotransferase subunit B
MQALYEAGRADEIVQETRGWDEHKQQTFSQRSKENANDYRYFPDPDIPKFKLSEIYDFEEMKKELPELPWQKRQRYMTDLGLKGDDAFVFASDVLLAEYFEDIVSALGDKKLAQTAANYLLTDLLGIEKKEVNTVRPSAAHFAELIAMVAGGEVTSRGAKDLLALMVRDTTTPKVLAKEKGLLQDNNEETLKPIIQSVIADNEKIIADYKSGKEAALQALLGQVMKLSRGAANPAIAAKLLKELLA